MSLFDVPQKSTCLKFEFFHSLEIDMDHLLKKAPLFECHVHVQKQSGLFIKCPIKIIDEKLILFKVLTLFLHKNRISYLEPIFKEIY